MFQFYSSMFILIFKALEKKKEKKKKKMHKGSVAYEYSSTSQTFFIAFRYGRETQAKIKYISKQNLDSITGIW